nr:hypothetical protein [Tanacetum cinerariifolium]
MKSIDKRTQNKRESDIKVNERHMQSKEGKVDSSKALDASLIVTECSGIMSDKQVTSSSLGNYITHAVDADIRLEMTKHHLLSSGLVPNPHPSASFVPPSRHEWDLVFQPVFDEFFSPPTSVASPFPIEEAPAFVKSTGSPSSTIVDQDAPSPKSISEESSSSNVIPTTVHSDAPILKHLMPSKQNSLEPTLHEITPATPSSGLVPNPHPSASFVPPSRHEWDLVFQPVFDEFFSPPTSVASPFPIEEAPAFVKSTGSPSSTIVDQDAPSPKSISEESSSSNVIPTTVHSDAPILKHLSKWTKDHPLVPSCFVIFDLEPLSLSFYFVILYEIFKSLPFSLDRLCRLTIFCLDHNAHTLHHLESLLTISLDRLDILKEDLVYQSLQKSLSLCLSFLDS